MVCLALSDSQRWLLREQLRRVAERDETIERLNDKMGPESFERRGEERLAENLVRRPRQMGYDVTATKPTEKAAARGGFFRVIVGTR